MGSGSLGTTGWKSLSVSTVTPGCVSGWVGWCSAVSPEWFIRFAGRRQRERGGNNSGSRAGSSYQPAGWLGVLTPHLTSMGTEQPPLLSSPPGRLWEQGGGNRSSLYPLSLCFSLGCQSLGSGPGHDERGQQLWQRDLSGRPGLWGLHCRLFLGSEMAQWTQSRCQSGSRAVV